MNYIRKVCFYAVTLFALTANAQSFDKEKLDQFLDLIESNNQGMGSLAISKNGVVEYSRAIGFSSVEEKIEANENTLYRIGSITKTFTATLIMQLVEQKKLTLSDNISSYFPKLPNAEKITITHLLRHRSGIYNITNEPDFTEWMISKHSREQLFKKILSAEPVFEPDSKAEYSNSNYILLTLIIEDVEQKSYQEVLKESILDPLELKYSDFGDQIEIDKNEAYSYFLEDKTWQSVPESDISIPLGAGGIVSTPTELNFFFHQLFSGSLLNASSIEAMTQIEDRFGLGLLQVPFYSKKGFGHNGGIDAFASMAYYFPEDQVAVSYFSNGTVMPINDILVGALSIYFGKSYDLPTFRLVEREILEKYIGTYSSPAFPLDISIFLENDQLKAQATGQGAFTLETVTDKEFKYSAAGIKVKFDEEGSKMKFEQMGRSFELNKK
ncbi:MAG: serine hydrolase domain-containing protein [Bacteroidota bacterium]